LERFVSLGAKIKADSKELQAERKKYHKIGLSHLWLEYCPWDMLHFWSVLTRMTVTIYKVRGHFAYREYGCYQPQPEETGHIASLHIPSSSKSGFDKSLSGNVSLLNHPNIPIKT